ncbi:MAG TPA: hypothetical protein VNO82_20360, partial [Solirubrobacteraceae bacterium]|nr:hypothetical protein [Solirubrobacteraceae bacterium]
MLLRLARQLLRHLVRAQPRGDDTVVIVLMSAWGMGGTIRAAHNLAGHLAAQGWRVRILSVFRTREEPFFGSFPAGVEVIALDDRRRPAPPLLRRLPSALVHPVEDSRHWNLWVDLQLVRWLRRTRGVLVTTRPSLNLIAADLAPTGLVTVGLEQVNLATWTPRLRDAMARLYPRLDALVTLTEEDGNAYAGLLRPRLELIPNTVRPMGGADADLAAPVVVAAGRL